MQCTVLHSLALSSCAHSVSTALSSNRSTVSVSTASAPASKHFLATCVTRQTIQAVQCALNRFTESVPHHVPRRNCQKLIGPDACNCHRPSKMPRHALVHTSR